MTRRGWFLPVVLLAWIPGWVRAQSQGGGMTFSLPPLVTSNGVLGSSATSVSAIPDRERLEGEAANARIHLGPFRIKPRLYIGNLGYTNNFFGETDEERTGDVTATIGGGVNVIVPIGSRVFLRGSVLPAYTWYAKNEERRSFGGTYDASLFAYVGRLSIQVAGASDTGTVNISSEVEQPVKQKMLYGRLMAEYELSSRMACMGNLGLNRRSYGGDGLTPEEEATVSGLDGTDSTWSVGIRRRFGSRLFLGVSYERAEFVSVDQGELRDAVSDGILGSAFLEEGRLLVNAYGGYRDARPAEASSFPGYSGPSGGANVSYRLGRVVSLGLLGSNVLVASLYQDNAAYVERRVGTSLGVSVSRVGLWATYETGRNDYLEETPVAGAGTLKRSDLVDTIRGSLTLDVLKYLFARLDLSQSWYTSNVPGYDRSTFQVGLNVGFRASGTIEILP